MPRSAPKKVNILLALLVVIAAGFLAIRAPNPNRLHEEKQTRFMMDTYVTIYGIGPQNITSRAVTAALDIMGEVDKKFNPYNEKSPVYAFNKENIPITDREVAGLVRTALEVSRETGGKFDINVLPLSELWGFSTYSEKPPHLPSN